MQTDFESYGIPPNLIHTVMAGSDKVSDKQIVISTWQSQHKINKSDVREYDLVIGDEAHQFKAKSLTNIMSKLTSCPYRFGMTGTLDGTTTHKLVLEGLFGPVRHVTRTQDLIEKKQLADFSIDVLVLEYSKDERSLSKQWDYNAEMSFLISHDKRNKFISNLCASLEGNSLVLFQRVEAHGKVLYDLIKNKASANSNVFFVHGGTDAKSREEVRSIVDQQTDSIIVASYGVFSTGVNIRNLDNIVFASPSKSRIRNLQSIGRGLRRTESKTKAKLLDVADDLAQKNYRNYTLRHFLERLKIYREEKFPYKIHNIRLSK
jgi:superfamily II DNA or RNA helicase